MKNFFFRNLIFLVSSLLLSAVPSQAQKYHFYRNDGKHNVYDASRIDSMTFTEGNATVKGKTKIYFKSKAFFDVSHAHIDSITFGDRGEVAQLTIRTENNVPVDSKENYVSCTLSMDGKNMFADYEGVGRIRGRGNSTWAWYPKKPYRIKLNESSPMLGLDKNKDWLLLANYRDPTFLMNSFAFELGDYLGMPFTNHSRFCRVELNGQDLGLYLLTEQIETGGNRVDISETKGVILSLDLDDGPGLSPGATDNFFSKKWGVPVCIKFPKDEALTPEVKQSIEDDFASLEQLMDEHIYANVSKRIDLKSLMNFLIVQEMTRNVELEAPRSMYMYMDSLRVWHFGPLWDFDAGFDFDWGQMYTGHNYFGTYEGLIMGTDPAQPGSGWNVSMFFRRIFRSKEFVAEYKAYWNRIKDMMLPQVFEKLENYKLQIEESMRDNYTLWSGIDSNFDKQFDTEYERLKTWLVNRLQVLDKGINAYPPGR